MGSGQRLLSPAVLVPLVPAKETGQLTRAKIELKVNGMVKQS
jgi:hypothetical protein